MHVTPRAGVKEGYILAVPTGVNLGGTLVNEDDAGLSGTSNTSLQTVEPDN